MPAEGERVPSIVPDGVLWTFGAHWRFGRRFWLEYWSRTMYVYELDPKGGADRWCERFTPVGFTYDNLRKVDSVASKWITAAVVKRGRAKVLACSTDVDLFKDRPALRDFMTELESEEGKARETSVLMVAISDSGVRVGLKDDDAGGWLWREEVTFQKALNAIEKALQSGNVVWSVPGGRGGRKAK
jgi:hypothetical protein